MQGLGVQPWGLRKAAGPGSSSVEEGRGSTARLEGFAGGGVSGWDSAWHTVRAQHTGAPTTITSS